MAFEQALGHGRSVHVEPARFEQQKHEEAAEPREGGYEEKQNEDVGVAGRARGLQRVGKIALLRQLQQTANHHEKNQHKLHPPTLPQIPTVPRVLEQTRYYLFDFVDHASLFIAEAFLVPSSATDAPAKSMSIMFTIAIKHIESKTRIVLRKFHTTTSSAMNCRSESSYSLPSATTFANA